MTPDPPAERTPLTDAAAFRYDETGVLVVAASFARSLEAQLRAAEQDATQMRAILADLGNGEYETEYDGRMMTLCLGCIYTELEGHRKDCLFIKARHVAAAIQSAAGEGKP